MYELIESDLYTFVHLNFPFVFLFDRESLRRILLMSLILICITLPKSQGCKFNFGEPYNNNNSNKDYNNNSHDCNNTLSRVKKGFLKKDH